MKKALSPTTERLYETAQNAFVNWCYAHRVRMPATHQTIARYLTYVGQTRGNTAVPVHLSAIAKLAREANRPLDTKANVIQAILKAAREATL